MTMLSASGHSARRLSSSGMRTRSTAGCYLRNRSAPAARECRNLILGYLTSRWGESPSQTPPAFRPSITVAPSRSTRSLVPVGKNGRMSVNDATNILGSE